MDSVIHQVLLVDLNGLAEVWEISSACLGLDISEEGHLVPKLIGADDNWMNVADMEGIAQRDFPRIDALDIVVQMHKTSIGNMIGLATLDQVSSPIASACKSHWWRFTDDYVERIDLSPNRFHAILEALFAHALFSYGYRHGSGESPTGTCCSGSECDRI